MNSLDSTKFQQKSNQINIKNKKSRQTNQTYNQHSFPTQHRHQLKEQLFQFLVAAL